MAGIFISYRRSDTEGYASRLSKDSEHASVEKWSFSMSLASNPDKTSIRWSARRCACNVLLGLIGLSWAQVHSTGWATPPLTIPNPGIETAAALRALPLAA